MKYRIVKHDGALNCMAPSVEAKVVTFNQFELHSSNINEGLPKYIENVRKVRVLSECKDRSLDVLEVILQDA